MLDGADGASVLAFLESLLERWAKSSLFWVVSNFRPFLKFTGRTDLVDAVNLAGVRRSHAILPVVERRGRGDGRPGVRVGGGERAGRGDHLARAHDGTAGLRHRRAAVGGYRLAWADDRDRATKDGQPAGLPLPALLMTKLADYVLDERPGSADDHVFLRSVAPHTRLGDHASVHRVTVATFRKAGVTEREGRDPASAPQRRVPAAGRGGCAPDDLGRARPRQRGIDEPVYECRPGASARMRAAGSRRRAVMSDHGFTSVFAAELDAYVAFKKNMGFSGASRIWYLKQFDAYCAEHDRTAFDRDTVEGWVVSSWRDRADTDRGCPTSATSADGSRRTGSSDAYVLSEAGKPRSFPPTPTC